MRKGIIYITDNVPPEDFLKIVRKHLKRASDDIPIVWVSQKRIDEIPNIVLTGLKRHHRSICFQILAGLRQLEVDIVYIAEHDVLYHPSHFEFVPPEKDVFYYNTNRWWLREGDGQASHKNNTRSLSNLVAYWDLMNDFYTRRTILYEQGISCNVKEEPGKHKAKELPDYKSKRFSSQWPNVDIRHKYNYTKSDKFRNSYILSDEIPGWGRTKGRYAEFINADLPDTN